MSCRHDLEHNTTTARALVLTAFSIMWLRGLLLNVLPMACVRLLPVISSVYGTSARLLVTVFSITMIELFSNLTDYWARAASSNQSFLLHCFCKTLIITTSSRVGRV